METNRKSYLEVGLTLERREDGGLRVFSDDIPELLLSNSDSALVMADIAPALETILSEKFGRSVKVGELHHIREDLDDRGIISPTALSTSHRKYVADLEGA